MTQAIRRFALLETTVKLRETSEDFHSPFLSWFTHRPWALATSTGLVVIVLISVFAMVQLRGRHRETERAEAAIVEQQRIREEDRQTGMSVAQDRQKSEDHLRGRIEQLEAELRESQKAESSSATVSPTWKHPAINVPIVVLGSERGLAAGAIEIPQSAREFLISIPLETKAAYRTYRITILKNHRPIWASNDVTPDSDNALTIGFASSFFQSGKYTFQVQGLPPRPGSATVASYPFNVRKRK